MDNMMTKRNDSFDQITGIMILWMMVYHAFGWAHLGYNNILYRICIHLFYCFMPWFYFKSGVFFQSIHTSTVSNSDYCKKCVKSLLVPMLIWWIFGYILTIPEFLMSDKPVWKLYFDPIYVFLRSGDTIGNAPLWFFLSFFFVKIFTYYISGFRYFYLIVFPLLIVGYLLSQNSVKLPLGFSTIPIGMSFYIFGYVYSTNREIINGKWMTTLCLIILFLCNLFKSSYVDVHFNKVWYGHYICYLIASLSAILVLLKIFDKISIKPLSWCGKRSLYFFVLHWPIFYCVKIIYRIFQIDMFGEQQYFYLSSLLVASISFCVVIILIPGSRSLMLGKLTIMTCRRVK